MMASEVTAVAIIMPIAIAARCMIVCAAMSAIETMVEAMDTETLTGHVTTSDGRKMSTESQTCSTNDRDMDFIVIAVESAIELESTKLSTPPGELATKLVAKDPIIHMLKYEEIQKIVAMIDIARTSEEKQTTGRIGLPHHQSAKGQR